MFGFFIKRKIDINTAYAMRKNKRQNHPLQQQKNAKTDFFAHIRRKCVAHRAYKCVILNTLCIKNIKIRKMWILNFYLCHVGAADNNK